MGLCTGVAGAGPVNCRSAAVDGLSGPWGVSGCASLDLGLLAVAALGTTPIASANAPNPPPGNPLPFTPPLPPFSCA